MHEENTENRLKKEEYKETGEQECKKWQLLNVDEALQRKNLDIHKEW